MDLGRLEMHSFNKNFPPILVSLTGHRLAHMSGPILIIGSKNLIGLVIFLVGY